MTFFVDANVVLYAAVDSEYRGPCLEILEAIVAGADGKTSTACLEEVWYLETSGRLGKLHGVTENAYRVLAPLLPVTDDAFRLALSLGAPGLGTNDRLHAATCAVHDIDVIVTADVGFDGIPKLRRVDPLDGPARRRLLGRGA